MPKITRYKRLKLKTQRLTFPLRILGSPEKFAQKSTKDARKKSYFRLRTAAREKFSFLGQLAYLGFRFQYLVFQEFSSFWRPRSYRAVEQQRPTTRRTVHFENARCWIYTRYQSTLVQQKFVDVRFMKNTVQFVLAGSAENSFFFTNRGLISKDSYIKRQFEVSVSQNLSVLWVNNRE